MSRLSQVDAKIARANRAFRLSSRIIAAARGELEGHGAWLDRQATWAKEVKRHHRLLRRKLKIRALMRFVVGLLFAAPFALARAVEARLKRIPTQAWPQSRPAKPAPRRNVTQHRISLLDARLAAAEEDAPHAALLHDETSTGGRLPPGAVSHVRAELARFANGGNVVSPVALVILVLVAAGAVRAMLSGPPAEAPVLPATRALEPKALEPTALESKTPDPKPHATASLTVAKTPKVEQSAPLSGFAMLPAAASSEALQLPLQTVSEMMGLMRPLALEPTSSGTAPAPMAQQPLAPKQANNPKRKRTLAAPEPEAVPWWKQWSWTKLR